MTGALFAIGLVVSGMTSPAKVIGFLDVGGAWDPTLAFVMAGAVAVHAVFTRVIRRRPTAVFSGRFHVPSERVIDKRLIAGAAIFGIGWGLSGYCPGPALVGAGGLVIPALVFLATMLVGIALTRRYA
ncbi:MAG: YeeE/YedE family protein [Deltaproteobacteria bacterium]|nr:YeeE/YedE family protein [Deltaproteobacteria bacterium]